MPFPNEHSCRLEDPGKFQAGSFKRMKRDHEGKPYSVIIGRKKGETETSEQAYRYGRDDWTAADARAHCNSHEGKFEPASDSDSAFGNYPHVVGDFMSTAWAIMPEKLQAMIDFLDAKIEGVVFSQDEIEARIGRRATRFRGVKGNIAILGLYGVIGHRMNCMSAIRDFD
jgi:hypothetical protein